MKDEFKCEFKFSWHYVETEVNILSKRNFGKCLLHLSHLTSNWEKPQMEVFHFIAGTRANPSASPGVCMRASWGLAPGLFQAASGVRWGRPSMGQSCRYPRTPVPGHPLVTPGGRSQGRKETRQTASHSSNHTVQRLQEIRLWGQTVPPVACQGVLPASQK